MLCILSFGYLGFFFPLRVWGKFTCCSWLLESRLCLEFISATLTPGPFLKTPVINRPPDLWITPAIKHCWSKCIGNIHKATQQLFMPNPASLGNEILRENQLPGLWIRVESAWSNTRGLVSYCFFPLKLHPPLYILPPWATAPCWGAQKAALSGRKLELGTPAPRDLEARLLFQGPGAQMVGPPSLGCTGDFVHNQANQTIQV